MAPQLSWYFENADSVSSANAGFALQSAKSSRLLYLLGSNYAGGQVATSDVVAAITQILGSVSTKVGDGRLNRTLPLADPLFTWLYAAGVNRIRGLGTPYQASSNPLLEAPPLPSLSAYPNYEFAVEFAPRPYIVVSDASVPKLSADFTNRAGNAQTATIAGEWVRFTNWWYERKFESITARQGFMRFRMDNGGAANNVTYSDMPKLFLPDSVLHILWHQVPYRYVYSPNSYIDNLIGYVNQNDFTTWKPAELLYIGYTAKPYTPPVQGLDQEYTGTTGYIYSSEKWVDVELLFLRTKRQIGSPGEIYIPNPGNGNWIQSGWNLMPWLGDRLFHYVTSVAPEGSSDLDKSFWKPLFPSAEFGLLFTDPDAAGGFQVANL